MQQRQLRLGDILDDYCTRERRLTNHVVVAMVGDDVRQTRCTTCDTEHEYKHAKVPRQRRKLDSPAALYAQVAAGAPKRVTATGAPMVPMQADEHDDDTDVDEASMPAGDAAAERDEHADDPQVQGQLTPKDERIVDTEEDQSEEDAGAKDREEGPVHRPLIRASLPREGQPPPARPIPEFTIRQPGGRPNRFRPRHQGGGGGQGFRGDRPNGNGFGGPGGHRAAGPRHGGGRPPQGAMPSRQARRHGSGRKRQK
jgi:hypothetical protein